MAGARLRAGRENLSAKGRNLLFTEKMSTKGATGFLLNLSAFHAQVAAFSGHLFCFWPKPQPKADFDLPGGSWHPPIWARLAWRNAPGRIALGRAVARAARKARRGQAKGSRSVAGGSAGLARRPDLPFAAGACRKKESAGQTFARTGAVGL